LRGSGHQQPKDCLYFLLIYKDCLYIVLQGTEGHSMHHPRRNGQLASDRIISVNPHFDAPLPFLAIDQSVSSTPTIQPLDAMVNGATIGDLQALDHACALIYRRWSRYLSEAEAREQSNAFRRRCERVAAAGHPADAELDATLAIVSDCMGDAP
jgi:hypothetical protein